MPRKLTNEEYLSQWTEFAKNIYTPLEEYKGKDIKIKCFCKIHNIEFYGYTYLVSQGIGCPICTFERRADGRRKKHEEFLQELKDKHIDIKPLEEYKGADKKIRFVCPEGHEFEMIPSTILAKGKCPVCSNRTIIEGLNSFWDEHPEFHDLIHEDYVEFAKSITSGSGKEIKIKCPDCGTYRMVEVDNLTHKGLHCLICSDNISYPNKVLRQLMIQLPVENLEFEYDVKDNGKHYRFDIKFLYNNKLYFIEIDGRFHIEETQFKTLDRNKEVDRKKNELAKELGGELIRIPCYESNINTFKTEVENSLLNNIFDLSNIDWDKCDKNAQKNRTKRICEFLQLNKQKIGRKEFSKISGISPSHIDKCIEIGVKFGWCDEDVFISKGRFRTPLKCIDKNTKEVVGYFRDCLACSNFLKENYNYNISAKIIRDNLNSTRKSGYKYDYEFQNVTEKEMYDYLRSILIDPDNVLETK